MECVPKCKAAKLLIAGLVLILVEMYTNWDIWVVIGTLLIIKAIYIFIWPVCPCCDMKDAKKKK